MKSKPKLHPLFLTNIPNGKWFIVDDQWGRYIGSLPYIFRRDDLRPAAEQANERYHHGGGWRPSKTKWSIDPKSGVLSVDDGDPPYYPVAAVRINDEMVYVYRHSWVAIVQTDGKFEVSRMD